MKVEALIGLIQYSAKLPECVNHMHGSYLHCYDIQPQKAHCLYSVSKTGKSFISETPGELIHLVCNM